jgi:hypothetical protein
VGFAVRDFHGARNLEAAGKEYGKGHRQNTFLVNLAKKMAERAGI